MKSRDDDERVLLPMSSFIAGGVLSSPDGANSLVVKADVGMLSFETRIVVVLRRDDLNCS